MKILKQIPHIYLKNHHFQNLGNLKHRFFKSPNFSNKFSSENKFADHVLKSLPDLIAFNIPKGVSLAVEYFETEIEKISSQLEIHVRFDFFKELFSVQRGRKRTGVVFKKYMEMMIEREPEKVVTFLSESGNGWLILNESYSVIENFIIRCAPIFMSKHEVILDTNNRDGFGMGEIF